MSAARTGIIYLHAGDSESFLVALARAVAAGDDAFVEEASRYHPRFFETAEVVASDATAAAAFLRSIRAAISPAAARRLYYVSLAESSDAASVALAYLRLAERLGKQVENYEADAVVRRFHQMASRVSREVHRLKGLVRFRKTAEGFWYAPLSPDHRVLVPLACHFRRRMPGERWGLHDLRRGGAVLWDGETLRLLDRLDHATGLTAGDADQQLSSCAEEMEARRLWATFFEYIADPSRVNPRLQARMMPRRYWRYLVELCESPQAV